MIKTKLSPRATSLDDVFDYLYDEIASLRLAPGDKISEAEIASQFGVSRQPVRDAFRRLESMNMLLIRPQRATLVKRFSLREIEKSRFVRQAIEKEVLIRAAEKCDAAGEALLAASLNAQSKSLQDVNYDEFVKLDYDFHKILCHIAKADFAFDVIMEEKSRVDRLCVLSSSTKNAMSVLIQDHCRIADAVISHDTSIAVEEGMYHLSRLDETINQIYEKNAEYFDV